MNENFEYPKGYDVYWEKWIDIYEQEMEEEQSVIEQLKSMDFEFSEEEQNLYEELAEEGMPGFKSIKTIMNRMKQEKKRKNVKYLNLRLKRQRRKKNRKGKQKIIANH